MALTTVPVSLSATALTLTTAAQPNITSVGTLTGLTVSGNIAGTLTTAAQPNITSVGTLSSLLTAAAKIKLTDTGNATVAALQITDAGLGISSPTTDQMNFITADATRAVIDANGKVGIGSGATSPASLLHIDGAHSGGPIVTIHQTAGSSSADSGLDVETSSTGTIIQRWLNSGTPVMHVRGNGNVGIGPNTPAAKLDVQGTAMAERYRLSTNSATTYWDLRRDSSSGHLVISDDGLGDVITVRQDTGNVGIGMSPSQALDIDKTSGLSLRFYNGGSFKAGLQVADSSGQMIGTSVANDFAIRSQSNLLFSAGGNTEAMRIDSSGNVLLGTNTTSAGNEGVVYFKGDSFRVTRDGNEPLVLDRLTNQGKLVEFRQAGTTRGLIGTVANDLFICAADSGHHGLRFHDNGILPTDNTGAIVNAAADLGDPSYRFKDLYLSGDVITGGGGTTSTGEIQFVADSTRARIVGGYDTGGGGYLSFRTDTSGGTDLERMKIDRSGIIKVKRLSDLNNTGAIDMYRYNIGHIANYTGNLHLVTHAGIDHYEFTIQGNNTYQDLFNNIYSMGFELYIQLGDAASRDHALYSVNATSPAYGVSTFTQVYYNNGGWNTGSFTLQMIGTPGDNTEYTIQAKFTSYYSSSNTATGYVQIRRLY